MRFESLPLATSESLELRLSSFPADRCAAQARGGDASLGVVITVMLLAQRLCRSIRWRSLGLCIAFPEIVCAAGVQPQIGYCEHGATISAVAGGDVRRSFTSVDFLAWTPLASASAPGSSSGSMTPRSVLPTLTAAWPQHGITSIMASVQIPRAPHFLLPSHRKISRPCFLTDLMDRLNRPAAFECLLANAQILIRHRMSDHLKLSENAAFESGGIWGPHRPRQVRSQPSRQLSTLLAPKIICTTHGHQQRIAPLPG